MNGELKLYSIVRRKRYHYEKGKIYKIFPDLLKQNFYAGTINTKWCTDFTYLFLKNGHKRYNCSIIDLHDRSIVASVTGKKIDSYLAIETLRKAVASQKVLPGTLILHSDQGSQFTSKAFTEFCASQGIKQSMSRAGCPYDNAPMERYFNTLKNELIYLHTYETDWQMNRSIEEFAYGWYNHGRPHSYNHYQTPYEARCDKKSFGLKCYKNA
jgi:transposase InsO family protein